MFIDSFSVKISVDMEPGLYIVDDDRSSTGKTWLCKLLKKYREYGLRVDGYTYYDFIKGTPIPKDVDLLVIDRYDMYRDELVDDIMELGKSAIVLIDSKCFPKKLKGYDYCSIYLMASDFIEVI